MNTDTNLRTLQTLTSREDLPADVRNDLNTVISDIRTPLTTDNWIYRLVVIFLGLTILSTVIGGIYLAYLAKGQQGIELSPGIVAIGSAAVGALAGLLAPSPKT
jgi:hypothetical protein